MSITWKDGWTTGELAQSPLMAAAHEGHAEVVKFLISRKANVNLAEPTLGWSAIHFASSRGEHSPDRTASEQGCQH